jgi:hypothetical protein
MKIKKFKESLEDYIIDGERNDSIWKGKYAKAHFFIDKLEDGFSISISKDNINDFFNVMKDIEWLKLPKNTEHYNNDTYYFVLIGKRLLHSDKPYFGGHELEVYNYNNYK